MTWAGFIAIIKTWQTTATLVQGFVDAWQAAQLGQINSNYEQRKEEREAIIWAMEQARVAHDIVKMRALNRQLALLDGSGVVPERSV